MSLQIRRHCQWCYLSSIFQIMSFSFFRSTLDNPGISPYNIYNCIIFSYPSSYRNTMIYLCCQIAWTELVSSQNTFFPCNIWECFCKKRHLSYTLSPLVLMTSVVSPSITKGLWGETWKNPNCQLAQSLDLPLERSWWFLTLYAGFD